MDTKAIQDELITAAERLTRAAESLRMEGLRAVPNPEYQDDELFDALYALVICRKAIVQARWEIGTE